MTVTHKQELAGRVSVGVEATLPGPQPHTAQLLIVFPLKTCDLEGNASVGVAKGVQWWTPGVPPKLKLVNRATSTKAIEQGVQVAVANATNCDDLERVVLLKEPAPTLQGAEPPPETAGQVPPTVKEPEVRVSEANTGQLGHQSRLRLLEIITRAKKTGLFPANPKIVAALPGREVQIPLIDENVSPVACRQQQYNPVQKDIVSKQVDLWLATGIIRYSTSAWCSPTSTVKNKDGSHRVTVDYRPLNAVTKKDSGGLGTLAAMHHRWTCTPRTTSCPFGKPTGTRQRFAADEGASTSFTRYGFGLMTIPAVFSTHLGDTLRPVENKGGVERWLDDVLLHSAILEEHFALIEEVFDLLKDAG